MAKVPQREAPPALEVPENTGQVIDAATETEGKKPYDPTETEKELASFIIDHTDRWRDYRDQNFLDDWLQYERIFRGKWAAEDKTRDSERSKLISPATQQAIETRHAEIMEAIFGQGEFFDIKDDVADQNGPIDVEKLKNQLYEDFAQDKIRKSFDQITLLGEIYGTGIGEIVVKKVKQYVPMQVPTGTPGEMAYGAGQKDRVSVQLVPTNPKNFIWDPNGTSVDDCMGVAVEKYVSVHRIAEKVASGEYRDTDVGASPPNDDLEATQEAKTFENDRVLVLTYYGLIPREYLNIDGEEIESLNEAGSEFLDDYTDMVEAIVEIADGRILKVTESPYMMQDRPILVYQADTVPNRLPGRGTAEKALNMQKAVDGSMRSHMDSLALTIAPMMGMDATRLPRGAKFEVKPGKAFMTNGDPREILMPFNFGTNDGAAMNTSKEFERMLLMATATIDSNGTPSQVSRDVGFDMATATMIKKYKRTLVNFQEDFLIPFIYKATWRYMQFDPQRYPSVDVKFVPTATLGIIAREYEQKQLAFLIQTLGAQSPLTPILMQGVIKNSSLHNREEMLQAMQQMSQPNPQQQAMQQQAVMLEGRVKAAEAALKEAQAEKARVEAQLEPQVVKAKVLSALSNNLNEDNEGADFERRARIAELMLKEADIQSNERIAKMQVDAKKGEEKNYADTVNRVMQ